MATLSKRVPGAPGKSAFEPDIKKPTEFFCCRCGKRYSKQNANFPVSKSALYSGNNGYLPICKQCITDLYKYYKDSLGSSVSAADRVCSKFDIYFSREIFDTVSAINDENVVMTTYIGRISSSENKLKSYDDTILELSKVGASSIEDEENAIQQGKMIWGLDLSVDDYSFLDHEFEDWFKRCDIDGKTRESMVREICVLKLLQNKALAAGDLDTYKKLSETIQKTLSTAELTPRQVHEKEVNNEIPLGVLLKKIEDEEPIPEPLPEFRDVDRIQKYIRVYFIGHLMKMLGLKNKYSEEYEEEMRSYIEDTGMDMYDDDSEDIYDYLMKNGFADEDPEEGEDNEFTDQV